MRATKIIPGLRNLTYKDRLQKIKLPTLKFRRLRGDLIEMYKIVNKCYSPDTTLSIRYNTYAQTRGNNYKIFAQHISYDMRKYFFTNRVMNVWNSLPNSVVCAPSMNAFKNILDGFMSDQEMVYDWKEEIAGTGDCSFE